MQWDFPPRRERQKGQRETSLWAQTWVPTFVQIFVQNFSEDPMLTLTVTETWTMELHFCASA